MLERDVYGGRIARRAKVIREYGHEARGLDAPAPAVERATALGRGDEDLPLALARKGRQTRIISDAGLDVLVREKRDRISREIDRGTLDRRVIRVGDAKFNTGLNERGPR